MDIYISKINSGISFNSGLFNSQNYTSIQEGKKKKSKSKDLDHQRNKYVLWIWESF